MKDTTHQRILKLLSDGEWHHSNEICQPWIGGRQGISRICELRQKRFKIEDRKAENQKGNEYRILTVQNKLFNIKPKYYL